MSHSMQTSKTLFVKQLEFINLDLSPINPNSTVSNFVDVPDNPMQSISDFRFLICFGVALTSNRNHEESKGSDKESGWF